MMIVIPTMNTTQPHRRHREQRRRIKFLWQTIQMFPPLSIRLSMLAFIFQLWEMSIVEEM